jgi:hypothetical protein
MNWRSEHFSTMGASFSGWSCSLYRLYALIALHAEVDDIHGEGMFATVSKQWVWNTLAKDFIMPPVMLLFLVLVIFACTFGFMMYRDYVQRRAREKKRNQFHDRV